jgi:Na+/H+ antiporter NhaC
VIKTRPSFFIAAVLFFLLLAWIGNPYCHAQQDGEQTVTSDPQEKEVPEKIVGAPQNIKQKTGIWVFVVWLWISVFVIIYFLRLKIEEVDRLYRLKYFSAKKN